MTRRCTGCGEDRDLSRFRRRKGGGLRMPCKDCENAAKRRSWYGDQRGLDRRSALLLDAPDERRAKLEREGYDLSLFRERVA